jgi:hypothetical protein
MRILAHVIVLAPQQFWFLALYYTNPLRHGPGYRSRFFQHRHQFVLAVVVRMRRRSYQALWDGLLRSR